MVNNEHLIPSLEIVRKAVNTIGIQNEEPNTDYASQKIYNIVACMYESRFVMFLMKFNLFWHTGVFLYKIVPYGLYRILGIQLHRFENPQAERGKYAKRLVKETFEAIACTTFGITFLYGGYKIIEGIIEEK